MGVALCRNGNAVECGIMSLETGEGRNTVCMLQKRQEQGGCGMFIEKMNKVLLETVD